nr:hypothetical protein [Tanacetum cinerariifolium]
MEAGGKDRRPMLAPDNYVKWKSRIKRYIDTKPNHELIHYCLKNPSYKFTWADKEVPISEGIDNDIYFIIDACQNACEMWKAIERLKQEVEAAVVTSWRVLFVMPSQNIAKLSGFTMDDDPIVVLDMGHEIVHTLQVYDRPSQQFHTLGIIVLSIMDANFNNETDPWEFGLDVDDSDLHLTHFFRSSNSTHVESSTLIQNPVTIIPGPAGVVQLSSNTRAEPYPSTPNTVRIIPDLAGIVQQAKLLKEKVFILDSDGALMSTQKYMQKITEDVDEDDDFNSGAWVSATNYVMAFGGAVTGCLGDIDNFLKKGKLVHIVAIVKSCSPNMLGDLHATLKDISGIILGTIHHKVMGEGGYEKDNTVGVAMILKNVSVFTPKPSKHYLNITMRNVVEVFRKDTVFGSGTS